MKKLCFLLLVCIFASGAFASTVFTAATGNWNVDSNWDKGIVPDDTEEIKLYTADSVCTLDQTQMLYSAQKISIAGDATLEILDGGYIGSGKEFRVGASGVGGSSYVGFLNQTGGTLDIDTAGKLLIGYKAGGDGTYTISGGSLLGSNGGRMYIGCGGAAESIGTLIIQGSDAAIQFSGRIYLASDSASSDSRLGTATLQYELVNGAVSKIVADDYIAIDAGGGGTANLIVNADTQPLADVVLVQNTTSSDIPGVFDTFNGESGAEGTTVTILGSVMQLTYQYDADGDDQDNDIALIFLYSVTDLPYDPDPADESAVQDTLALLDWTNPEPNELGGLIYCDVYLGTEPNRLGNMDKAVITVADVSQIDINTTNFPNYGNLVDQAEYWWVVDAHDGGILLEGTFWKFTVDNNEAPVVVIDSVLPVWLGKSGTAGQETVQLSATVTDSDSTPDILWTQVDNGAPTVTIVTETDEDPTITFSQRGDYEFELTADDGIADPVTDTVRVVVGDDACDASHINLANEYDPGDVNQDCIIDLLDFAELIAANWLDCTDTLMNCGN